MFRSVIRDPGGNQLIRIVPDLGSNLHSIPTNGSLLLVPAGTVALVTLNGTLSAPYPPGRYSIFTGVDPFFVRMKNMMTRGDPGISLSIYYISPYRQVSMTLGSGPVLFQESCRHMTLTALASCTLFYAIRDPALVLESLVGAYNGSFDQEDLMPALQQLLTAPLRQALSTGLSLHCVTDIHQHLDVLSRDAASIIGPMLQEIGLTLGRLSITGVNIPQADLNRLQRAEDIDVAGQAQIALERAHLDQLWGGRMDRRILSEVLTGRPAWGGSASSGGRTVGDSSNASLMQMMLMSRLLPDLMPALSDMIRQTDLFRNTADSPSSPPLDTPPLPSPTRQCPSCRSAVPSALDRCPVCGHSF